MRVPGGIESTESLTSITALIHNFFSKLGPYNHKSILCHGMKSQFYILTVFLFSS